MQYTFSPEVMGYVQFATGYKGGGINPHPVFIQDIVPFKAETLSSYEIGAKTQWFMNRLRLNVAVFVSDYRNLQVTIIAPDASDVITNTGHVRVKGFEAELDAEPVPALLFNASVGYLDYKTLELGALNGAPGSPTLTTKPAYVPDWKINLGVQYAIDLMKTGTLTPRLDWTWQSKVFNDPGNNPLAAQPAYGLVDARLTWIPPDSRWTVSLALQNALNKLYYINKFDDSNAFNTVTGQPGMPRTVFATVRRSF